jgi:death on curing protein
MFDVIHSELLSEHGGARGIRAGGEELIEAAIARPRDNLAYDADAATLAAACLFGLVRNHGCVDGTRRVAFACAATFLRLDGRRLAAPEPDAYDAVVGLIEGRYTEERLASWIRENSEPVGA